MLQPSDTATVLAIAGGGSAGAAIDLYTRRVPNELTLAVLATGFTLALTHTGATSVTGALAGCAIGLALMLPGHVIGATGAGDVKLFAALGTLLGPQATLLGFLYTALAGGALGLAVAAYRKSVRATVERTAVFVMTSGANVATIEDAGTDNRFPYAPAIAIGTLIAALGM